MRVLKTFFILIFAFAVPAAVVEGSGGAASVVDVRVGEHETYHRVVVELTGPAGYSVVRRADGVVLMVNAGAGGKALEEIRARRPSTSLVAVEQITVEQGKEGQSARIYVSIRDRARFKQVLWKNPYRIVMDLFPVASPGNDRPHAASIKPAPAASRPGPSVPAALAAGASSVKPSLHASTGKTDSKDSVAPAPSGAATAAKPSSSAGAFAEVAKKTDESPAPEAATEAVAETVEAVKAESTTEDPQKTTQASKEDNAPTAASGPEVSGPGTMTVKGTEANSGGHAPTNAPAREQAARISATLPSFASISATERAIPLGDGWRWALRQRLRDVFRRGVADNDNVDEIVLRSALDISAPSRLGLMVKAKANADALAREGRAGDADTLRAIVTLARKGEGALELEALLREHPDTGFKPLGWFFLGRSYEARGLNAEARGYYARVEQAANGSALKDAAVFSGARVLYFEGKYSEAKAPLEAMHAKGFDGAGLWLANTLVMKGELARAGRLFGSSIKRPLDESDPETVLNMAELALAGRDYEGARGVYSDLASRYNESPLLFVYMLIRQGDAYRLEGEHDMAIKVYEEAEKGYKDLEHAAASMALADALVAEGSPESLMRAEGIFRSVSGSGTMLAVFAHMEAVRTEAELRLHASAMENLREFMVKYAASPLVTDLDKFKEKILLDWITYAYERDDHFGIVRAVARYGVEVPLGSKAEASLKAGKAFSALSLLPDAVKHLSVAMELGNAAVVEDAMLELAGVYLEQNDPGSAKRILKSFSNRFPRTGRADEAGRLRARASFMEGDYERYAESTTGADDSGSMRSKAYALYKTGRYKEAASAYGQAVELYALEGDAEGLISSYLGAADSKYALGRISEAVTDYRKALDEMDALGRKGSAERSWAAYRVATGYAAMENREKADSALAEIKGSGDVFGLSAAPVLTEPPAF